MMKGILIRTLAAALLCGTAMGQARKPTTEAEKTSYALGTDIGKNFKMQGVTVDPDMLAQGLRDALASDSLALSDQECEQFVMKFQQDLMAKQTEHAAIAAAGNRKTGDEFLAANKTKADVKTTASGLQYTVLVEGKGKKPKATDQVTVQYRGTLLDGKEFDSSYKNGKPATFRLTQVIKGWSEGLQLMSVGSKYKFFISADLAYGDRQRGADIAPGSTLIFEIELLEVQ